MNRKTKTHSAHQHHFRCLGHDRGSYYYLPSDGGQVIALSDSRHTKLGLLNLAPLGWWAPFSQKVHPLTGMKLPTA